MALPVVLLLEDSQEDSLIISRRLGDAVELTIAASQSQFDSVIHKHFDVALIDWNVPGVDSAEAISRLRAIQPAIPIIIISGLLLDEDGAARAMQVGADDFLLKDRLARLKSAVESACRVGRTRDKSLRDDRVELVAALLGGVVHDLNNVLSTPMMALTLLRPKVSEDMHRIVDLGQSSLSRGSDMLRHLMTFICGDNGDMTSVNVESLISDMSAVINRIFPKEISTSIEIEHGLPRVLGNKTQVYQVLLNLCVNARDAIAGRGHISIRAKETFLNNAHVTTSTAPITGPFVEIAVTDTGSGISPEALSKIFEPFFTTKPHGHGMGLSSCVEIIRLHNGFISVKSEVGKGTTFSVFLNSMVGGEETAVIHSGAVAQGNGERVLVVDDESSLKAVMKSVLENNGYNPVVSCAIESLSIFHRDWRRMDLVVMDVLMPQMNGIELAEEMRRVNPKAKILFTTVNPQNFQKLANESTLKKPFTSTELLRAVREMLDNDTKSNE